MKLLKEITEKEIGIKNPEKVIFKQRTAVRAVLMDKNGNVALLFVGKHNYHKIPGGGVEKDEELFDALKREVLEETGHHFILQEELGIITEQRNKIKEFQTSYCWCAKVDGEKEEHAFTEKELSQGFVLQWMPLEKAIETIKSEKPDEYEGKFIIIRDLVFLEEARSMLHPKILKNRFA